MISYEDIELILQGLEVLKKKSSEKAFTSGLMGLTLSSMLDEEDQAKVKEKVHSDLKKAEGEDEVRKKDIVRLEVKLYDLQEQLADRKGTLTPEQIIGSK